MVQAIVIGDLHINKQNYTTIQKFHSAIISTVNKHNPDFVVFLGDILHTHEKIHTMYYNLACKIIDDLSDITEVFVLIGNHDYIDNKQYLTCNHVFNPLKKWLKVNIIDTPQIAYFGDRSFVFCPYVEPNKFILALNTLIEDSIVWEMCDVIFAHQEIQKCKYNVNTPITSNIKESWDCNYPPVISGHIHQEQMIGDNFYYIGSAIQTNFGDTTDKYIWLIDFPEDSSLEFNYTKINLNLPKKETKTFDTTTALNYLKILIDDKTSINNIETENIKLVVCDKRENIIYFKETEYYKTVMQMLNIKIVFDVISSPFKTLPIAKALDFDVILLKLIDETDNKELHNVYKDIIKMS